MAKFRLRAREEEKLELPQELGEAGQGCQLPKFSTTEEQCQKKELAGSDGERQTRYQAFKKVEFKRCRSDLKSSPLR